METTTLLRRLLLVTAIFSVASTASFADTIDAAPRVQADEAGRFEFEVTFTAGPDGALLAYYEIDGRDNTSLWDVISDIYCTVKVLPRKSYVIPVSGHLLDSSVGAIVDVFVGRCAGAPLSARIKVLPPVPESTLHGPVEIITDSNGDFSYTATFTAGHSGVAIASTETQGGRNTEVPHVISDSFCLTPLRAGEPVEIAVRGRLQDLKARGLALISVSTCDGRTLALKTVVVPGPAFLRGDVNSDGRVTLADFEFLVKYLIHRGAAPGCLDAADVNASGRVDTQDMTVLFSHVVLDGPPPAAPFPECGLGKQPRSDLGCQFSNCSP